jgi:hypothetical protein
MHIAARVAHHALLCFALTLAQPAMSAGSSPGGATPMNPQNTKSIRIRITHGTSVMTAALDGSPTAADFAALLPLSLTLEDYASQEKMASLPRKLTTTGAPPGAAPVVADIAYYAPWNNLVIYYRDAPYAKGVIRLGRVDGGMSAWAKEGSMKVRIERVEN